MYDFSTWLPIIGVIIWMFALLTQVVSVIWGKYYLYSWKKGKRNVKISNPMVGVSIIRTIVPQSTNAKALCNLESLFKLEYSKFEILICLSQHEPELVKQIETLMEKYSNVNAKLFTKPIQEGVNPKINNMLQCYDQIKYDYIWICDSNIFVNEWSLSELASLLNPDIGMVHQLPFIKPGDYGFVHCLELIYFGMQHARWYLFFNFLGICCTNGMSSIMNKKYLDDVGGLKTFSCYIAEDHFMGKSCYDRNLKIVLSTEPALQNRDTSSVSDFLNRILRWQKLRISMVPTSALEPIIECFVVGLIGAFSISRIFYIPFLYLYSIHIFMWFVFDHVLLWIINGSSSPLHSFCQLALAWFYRELTTYWLFIRAISSHKVEWSTGTFDVHYGGKANQAKEEEKFA